jgi:hypothetical protein
MWYRDGDCRCAEYAYQERCPQCLHERVSLEEIRRLRADDKRWLVKSLMFREELDKLRTRIVELEASLKADADARRLK